MSNHATVKVHAEAVSPLALAARWVVTLHIVLLVVQLSTAVMFAAGWWIGALPSHMANARLVAAAGILEAIFIVPLPAARVSHLLRGMSVAIAFAEAAQLYFGSGNGLGLHVTAAMLIWAFSLTLFIKVWAPTWKLPA